MGIDNLEILLNGTNVDFNDNGTVDAADYVVWRNLFGQVASGLAADVNGNGVVELLDYQLWRAEFGKTTGSGSAVNAAVPEPSAALHLLAPAAVMLAHRRSGVGRTLSVSRIGIPPNAVSSRAEGDLTSANR